MCLHLEMLDWGRSSEPPTPRLKGRSPKPWAMLAISTSHLSLHQQQGHNQGTALAPGEKHQRGP